MTAIDGDKLTQRISVLAAELEELKEKYHQKLGNLQETQGWLDWLIRQQEEAAAPAAPKPEAPPAEGLG